MEPVRFVLVLHNHQPLGNFDDIIEKTYARAYLPFLSVLERHPKARAGFHHSGLLLEWLDRHHPDYLDRLGELVAAGRVELLTGGFFEPILPAIPPADVIGQIHLLNRWIENRLGTRPRGLWLTERVWEPGLASVLANAGVDYTLLDDTHFLAAGVEPDALWRAYGTEDQGRRLGLLPISRELRYNVPFREAEDTLALLRRVGHMEPGGLAVLGDDGEKFGGWPRTHRRVYDEGWLDDFLERLTDAPEVRMILPAEAADAANPGDRVYPPAAAYPEMMEWSLPATEQARFQRATRVADENADVARFLRGGIWRGFLARYPESDHLHKRVLDLTARIPDSPAGETARRHLWAATCNCAYWHGVFGGLYLPHLRDALYHELLAAEVLIEPPGDEARVRVADFNADGAEEIFLTNRDVTLVISPADGGAVHEFSHRPSGAALTNGLTRRYEAYHDRLHRAVVVDPDNEDDVGESESIHDLVLAKEAGLLNRLAVDAERRAILRARFLRPGAEVSGCVRGEVPDTGDFAAGVHQVSLTGDDRERGVHLTREGVVWQDGEARSLRVEKTLRLRKGESGFEADIRLVHHDAESGSEPIAFRFGVEWNFGLLDGRSDACGYEFPGGEAEPAPLNALADTPGVRGLRLRDGNRGVTVDLSWDAEARLWRYPVETVSLSEGGFERVYQASCVMPLWDIRLEPGESWKTTFVCGVAARGATHPAGV